MQQVFDWLKDHGWVAGAITAASVLMLLATGAAAVWMLGRLPPDYLTHTGRGRRFAWAPPPARIALIAGKNVLGWLLIAAGLAMLALPGQGLLTIIVGLVLVDLPGKRRLERTILCREGVFKRVNALRRKMGRPPLEHRHPDGEGGCPPAPHDPAPHERPLP
jgi:hypothetical protein